jgi:hypothetical protein
VAQDRTQEALVPVYLNSLMKRAEQVGNEERIMDLLKQTQLVAKLVHHLHTRHAELKPDECRATEITGSMWVRTGHLTCDRTRLLGEAPSGVGHVRTIRPL